MIQSYSLPEQNKISILQKLVSDEPHTISDYELNSRIKTAIITKITVIDKSENNTSDRIDINFVLPSNDTFTKSISDAKLIDTFRTTNGFESRLGNIIGIHRSNSKWVLASKPKHPP